VRSNATNTSNLRTLAETISGSIQRLIPNRHLNSRHCTHLSDIEFSDILTDIEVFASVVDAEAVDAVDDSELVMTPRVHNNKGKIT
jgi:hypothetical protein